MGPCSRVRRCAKSYEPTVRYRAPACSHGVCGGRWNSIIPSTCPGVWRVCWRMCADSPEQARTPPSCAGVGAQQCTKPAAGSRKPTHDGGYSGGPQVCWDAFRQRAWGAAAHVLSRPLMAAHGCSGQLTTACCRSHVFAARRVWPIMAAHSRARTLKTALADTRFCIGARACKVARSRPLRKWSVGARA